MSQLDLFTQEPEAEFTARWNLLDSPSPYRRLCYGLVSFRLRYLRRHGRHQEAADLAVAGGIRVCGGDMHWRKLYPSPKEAP